MASCGFMPINANGILDLLLCGLDFGGLWVTCLFVTMSAPDPIQPCSSKGSNVKYIRDESSDSRFRNESLMPHKHNPSLCDEVEIYHNASKNNSEPSDSQDWGIDDTVDLHGARCMYFMKGLRCHKGDCCDKLHRFPKEDGVMCIDFKAGICSRPASLCWFRHPGEHSEQFTTPVDAQYAVQPVAELLKYLWKGEKRHPGKYTKGWKE